MVLFDAIIEVRVVLHPLPVIAIALSYLVERELLEVFILDKGTLVLYSSRASILSHNLIVIRLVVNVRTVYYASGWLPALFRLGVGQKRFFLFFFQSLTMLVNSIVSVKLCMCLKVQEGRV